MSAEEPWPTPPEPAHEPSPSLPPPSAHPTSGVPGPSRGPQLRMPWIWVAVALILGATAGVVLGGWPLLGELRDLQARQTALVHRSEATEQDLTQLRQEHETLSQEHTQLTVDRDNLLVQARRMFEERGQAEAQRDLLASVFQRTASERLTLLSRLLPLEEQFADLQRSQATLSREREQLERQLAKAKTKSQETTLRARLAQMARKEQELNAALRNAKQQAQAIDRQKELAGKKLERLSKRMERLQQEYTEQVSENATLRRKMSRLPGDVVDIAREHERLIKDLVDTHYNMGVMFAKKRDYVRAEKEFQKVVELRPDDANAHYNLGVIYAEHLPDREKALAFFRKYLAVHPKGESANWAKQYIATWQAWEAQERLE